MIFDKNRMFLWSFALAVCLASALPSQPLAIGKDMAPGIKMAKQAIKKEKSWITSDHSKHEILKRAFKSGPEVTKACLSCHNQASAQFHKTIHWTWKNPAAPKETHLGKGGLSVNNF